MGKNTSAILKKAKKNTRKGKILDIDYENYAATAKVEIEIPGRAV
jgi:hypothetical protein